LERLFVAGGKRGASAISIALPDRCVFLADDFLLFDGFAFGHDGCSSFFVGWDFVDWDFVDWDFVDWDFVGWDIDVACFAAASFDGAGVAR
jgi:hypothetical protein